jgi:DNA topoisomerase-1
MIRREGDYKSGFKYYKNNIEIKDKAEIECIRELKIPPAYQNVVIVNTRKIVAYGYDSKGRKQVLYQPAFVKKQNEKKFKKIFASMETFEKLKDIVEHDMKNKKDIKRKEIAIIIHLIFTCGFRIGNKKYEKENNSVGLTTLKFSHMQFAKNKIHIDFIGKKGVRNIAICHNKMIYKYLHDKAEKFKETDYVFSYSSKNITSADVNEYLRAVDEDMKITSKDLRTWNANYLFMKFFKEILEGDEKLRNPVKKAIEMVANKLHNTYSICKKSYIDPKVVKYAEKMIE